MWTLPICLNINILTLNIKDLSNGLHNEIARLEKLKELDISARNASDLKEVEFTFRIFKNAGHVLVVF